MPEFLHQFNNLGHAMSANTNFFENKLIDFLFRGQALGIAGASAGAGTGPANMYVGLLATAADEAGTATEVTGVGYGRVAVPASLANWAGTQGAGTTTASTGTSATTSNNNAVTFPTPGGAWSGPVVAWGLFDSLTGGSALIVAPLSAQKTINEGDPAPYFGPGDLVYQLDN